MANKKTSKRQRSYTLNDMPIAKLKKGTKTVPHDPLKTLLDPKFIAEALVEALFIKRDKKSFLSILRTYVLAHNISELGRKTKLRRSTIYAAIAKDANPTIETVMALLNKSA